MYSSVNSLSQRDQQTNAAQTRLHDHQLSAGQEADNEAFPGLILLTSLSSLKHKYTSIKKSVLIILSLQAQPAFSDSYCQI